METLRPEDIRIDCPHCFGTGKQMPRVLTGPITIKGELGPCQLCLKAAKERANDA